MGAISPFQIKRKGMFFTFIAITITAIFVIILTPQADVSLQRDAQAVKARINTMDYYIDDLENSYLVSILRATTYKTILSLIFYINSTDSFLPNLDSAFYEVM